MFKNYPVYLHYHLLCVLITCACVFTRSSPKASFARVLDSHWGRQMHISIVFYRNIH